MFRMIVGSSVVALVVLIFILGSGMVDRQLGRLWFFVLLPLLRSDSMHAACQRSVAYVVYYYKIRPVK